MLAAARVCAACPPDTTCAPGGCDYTSSPAHGRSGDNSFGSGGANYDLAHAGNGAVSANAIGFAGDFGGGSGSVAARDTYVISGLPDGTPVTFHVALHVTGNAFRSCFGFTASAEVTMSEAGAGKVNAGVGAPSCDGALVDQVIGFDLTNVVGQSFTLAFSASAGAAGSASANITASLSFTGLPLGATLTSCQGFVLGGVTSVARTNWGALKLRYR
jgi:hypothetical protein